MGKYLLGTLMDSRLGPAKGYNIRQRQEIPFNLLENPV